jgi:hypothetical protein
LLLYFKFYLLVCSEMPEKKKNKKKIKRYYLNLST